MVLLVQSRPRIEALGTPLCSERGCLAVATDRVINAFGASAGEFCPRHTNERYSKLVAEYDEAMYKAKSAAHPRGPEDGDDEREARTVSPSPRRVRAVS